MPSNDGVSPITVGSQTAQSATEILFVQHLITQAQLDDIKIKSAQSNQSLDAVLESLHIVDGAALAEAKAKVLGVPFIALSETTFSPQALNLLPRAVAERFSVIPFLYDEVNKTLSVAMSDPSNVEAIQFVGQKTGLLVKSFAATPSEVTRAIGDQYRQELVSEVGSALKETQALGEVRTVDSK
ncbi:MAG: hypothetical protein AAB907_04095, partial [Patescibacteria group bacterium]